jgi:TatD DNase family protein
MWIDTHCHLDFEPLKSNIKSVFNLCCKNKIDGIIIPSIHPSNMDQVIQIADKYSNWFYALGIHPLYIEQLNDNDLNVLQDYIESFNPIAIGEIGLDLFVRKDNIDKQEYFLSQQLLLAERYDLPVILHGRSAIDLILKNLRKYKIKGGVLHAFNGSIQQAEEFIKMGFKLGFGGAMTNPRAVRLQKLAKEIPLDAIILETDSPDMPPFWIKDGGYNQPSEIAKIGNFFAKLRGQDLIILAEKIRANTQQAFPKIAELYT